MHILDRPEVVSLTLMTSSGYSGTPLAKKLGIKEHSSIRLIHAPDHCFQLFSDFPKEPTIVKDNQTKVDFIHYFTATYKELLKDLPALKKQIQPAGMIWISWPKKASKVPTDVDENKIRDLALSEGLVDVKVCAVDEIWSGLKLVIRLKDRV